MSWEPIRLERVAEVTFDPSSRTAACATRPTSCAGATTASRSPAATTKTEVAPAEELNAVFGA